MALYNSPCPCIAIGVVRCLLGASAKGASLPVERGSKTRLRHQRASSGVRQEAATTEGILPVCLRRPPAAKLQHIHQVRTNLRLSTLLIRSFHSYQGRFCCGVRRQRQRGRQQPRHFGWSGEDPAASGRVDPRRTHGHEQMDLSSCGNILLGWHHSIGPRGQLPHSDQLPGGRSGHQRRQGVQLRLETVSEGNGTSAVRCECYWEVGPVSWRKQWASCVLWEGGRCWRLQAGMCKHANLFLFHLSHGECWRACAHVLFAEGWYMGLHPLPPQHQWEKGRHCCHRSLQPEPEHFYFAVPWWETGSQGQVPRRQPRDHGAAYQSNRVRAKGWWLAATQNVPRCLGSSYWGTSQRTCLLYYIWNRHWWPCQHVWSTQVLLGSEKHSWGPSPHLSRPYWPAVSIRCWFCEPNLEPPRNRCGSCLPCFALGQLAVPAFWTRQWKERAHVCIWWVARCSRVECRTRVVCGEHLWGAGLSWWVVLQRFI